MCLTQDLQYFTYGKGDSKSMIACINRKTLKVTCNNMTKFDSMVFK